MTKTKQLSARLARSGTFFTSAGAFLISISCLSPVWAGSSGDNNKIAAVELSQRHSFWGDNDLTISMVGLRLQNKGRMGFTLVASQPDWQVTVFRDDDKTRYQQTLAQFCKADLVSDMVIKRRDPIWPDSSNARDFKFFQWSAKRIVKGPKVFEYLPLTGIADQQVGIILYHIYKLPCNGGICLHYATTVTGRDWMTGLYDNHAKSVHLVTGNAKPIMVSKSLFMPPPGYRPTKSMQDVLCSAASRNSCSDFDDMFAIGSKSDPRKDKSTQDTHQLAK